MIVNMLYSAHCNFIVVMLAYEFIALLKFTYTIMLNCSSSLRSKFFNSQNYSVEIASQKFLINLRGDLSVGQWWNNNLALHFTLMSSTWVLSLQLALTLLPSVLVDIEDYDTTVFFRIWLVDHKMASTLLMWLMQVALCWWTFILCNGMIVFVGEWIYSPRLFHI